PVHATVLSYPVITADMSFTHQGSILNLLGHEPSAEEVLYHSCEQNVSTTTPPAFIWHTASDASVPVANSLVYASALTKHQVPVELHIYPFGRHGLSTADEQTCDDINNDMIYDQMWMSQLKRWLKHYFI
ncbi:MAG: prolyl oligopeptidase family serine peptidase, partial [Lachnospiraceae bacterium]|nr:prolyl oligopeptidase family serine peptidase [Lachnospiraceae bacterium]